jgi:hypothetical protein
VKSSTTHHQRKATLIFLITKEVLKEKAHLHQRNQVFSISPMETVLNWVLLASLQ